jgi:folate-dependent phosphoribosylglycinamide formyltransferase PurN
MARSDRHAMKIGILTTGSPRAAIMAGALLAQHRDRIAGIFIERRYHKGHDTPGSLFRGFVRTAGIRAALTFAGEFATCAATLRLKPARAHHALTRAGERLGIPVEGIAHANHPDFIARYQALSPDLTILLDAGSILGERVLAVPRLGTINLHTGLLPRYKGINTAFHSLLEGADEVGCTVHEVVREIDAGRILGQCSFPVDRRQTLVWHRMRSVLDGAALLAQVVAQLARDGWPAATAPAHDGAPPYSWPKKHEVDRFRRSGGQLIRPRDLVGIWRAL